MRKRQEEETRGRDKRKRQEKEKDGEAEKRQKILKLRGNFVIDRQGKNKLRERKRLKRRQFVT